MDKQVNFILNLSDTYLRKQNIIAKYITNIDVQNLNPIKVVANKINQTQRNIQINQKKYFGYSVKEIVRYKRFFKAIEIIEKMSSESSKIDWFTIIIECGYYDQSQLIKDFNFYLNTNPTKYFKFRENICIPII